MKKPLILLLASALMGVFVLFASQNSGSSLEIVIKDILGNPVSGIEILIEEGNLKAKSDKKGSYVFTNLAPGEYTVVIKDKQGGEFKKSIKLKANEDFKLEFRIPAQIEYEIKEDKVSPNWKSQPEESSPLMPQKSGMYKGSGGSLNSIHSYSSLKVAEHNTESYDRIYDNTFKEAIDEPFSTFSIDVDAASYSNTRRFIEKGSLPPKDAVRVEEFINYFSYDYPEPAGQAPFSIYTEISKSPWNEGNLIAHIGLQGEKVDMRQAPASNLVFLLDISGSMQAPDKLPLLKKSFRLLVDNLRPDDRVAIAVYAGASGLALPSTPASDKQKILDAIENLRAGGSTAGAAGIKLAYKVAKENFISSGNNRVILATDGDFNVGVSSDAELTRLIEEKRETGIFLTVLGFGTGNYKDSKMEKLADKGNGNYSYIDNLLEAKKTLVNEMGGTLITIAKDVKIQVEFNPAKVKEYRLIGYENRLLDKKDFADDKKDAGELGSGHTVTALYEIVPAGHAGQSTNKSDSKYTESKIKESAFKTDEMMTVRFRYKNPQGEKSKLIERAVKQSEINNGQPSGNFNFSAAVAGFAMLLRDSEFKGGLSYKDVLELAKKSKGDDKFGYRRDFIALVEKAASLAEKNKMTHK